MSSQRSGPARGRRGRLIIGLTVLLAVVVVAVVFLVLYTAAS